MPERIPGVGESAKLIAIPLTLREAQAHIRQHHRHNQPPRGQRWSMGVLRAGILVGVAVVGRPISRRLDSRTTAEVLRCCVIEGEQKGCCSFLYAACWRAWRAMGGLRLITYTLQSESGASLRGAGWRCVHEIPAGASDGWQTRPLRLAQDVTGQAKFRWEMAS